MTLIMGRRKSGDEHLDLTNLNTIALWLGGRAIWCAPPFVGVPRLRLDALLLTSSGDEIG
jgi:hypothetical protein